MPRFRFTALFLSVWAAVCIQPTLAADRYTVWLADGTKLTARGPAWPLPGSPFQFENQDLVSTTNPVRLVRDQQAAGDLTPPFVSLVNGDIIGGRPVQLEPDVGRVVTTPRVRIQLEPPLMPVTGTAVAVRTDHVQRIVMAAGSSLVSPSPGTVVLADGRRFVARSIRWREYGLAILTTDGVVEAAFGDLFDVVFPNVDLMAAVTGDNMWASGASGAAIARIRTAGGAVLTSARVSREQELDRRRDRLTSSTYYYAQPAWADQPLAIPEEEIVCVGYRAADEAPLPMLPSATKANHRLIGQPAPWTANRSAGGGLLASGTRESDIGVAAHAYSAISFDLPDAARTFEAVVGLDRAVGEGGCVRCKIQADAPQITGALWDSGIIQGKDGVKATGPIDVKGIDRILLVAEFAHEERPEGADPFDIRDSVVWLAPLVKLDLSAGDRTSRALAVLPGATEWHRAGDETAAEQSVHVASRWNVPASNWDPVLTLSKGAELTLTRKLRVTRACDVVELLTVCPADLDDHDFTLKVNGSAVPWHNNADRNELRQWTLRHSRTRARDGEEESNLTDRLAYWWDLSPFRGQEVTLELTLRGNRQTSEIAWRGLTLRSAIGNLPDDGQTIVPDVPLVSLEPLAGVRRDRDQALKDAFPRTRDGEPMRFLGQRFTGGYGMGRNSSISFPLKPEYQKFVAIAGCSYQVAGPVQVLIDDRVVWERAAISSLMPAEQIEIAIPAGAKTLTLRTGSEALYYGFAAFAEAGFTK